MKENFAEKSVLKEKITNKTQDEFLEKVIKEISENHRKIIDDWCKAYLAHLYKEGMDIKPNCFTLFHKQPSSLTGDTKHEYWFEPREKQETANDKLLKVVMGQLAKLIDFVDEKHEEFQGKSDKIESMVLIREIQGFLNWENKDE